MKNSFHGRTVATLTATGQDKYHQGFGPLWTGFEYVEFNNVAELESSFNDEVCALVIEPIQGEGGVVEVKEAFMKKARELCDKYDALLIFDEIQCGLGRSGKLFAHEHYGVKPDIMTLSKALGGGLPMGCCIATEVAASAFKFGDHGSTFGGNPISAAAGKAAFEVLLEENLTENAHKAGLSFNKKLNDLKSVHSEITEVRGKGLMVGLQLNVPAEAYVNKCHELGLLVCQAGPNVIRFLPPLTVTENEIIEAVGILNKAFYEVSKVG